MKPILIFLAIACVAIPASAEETAPPEPMFHGYFGIAGMRFFSGEAKATYFDSKRLTKEMKEHINRKRWTKGQYKLPEAPVGFIHDLNGDGTDELFIATGEVDEFLNTHWLVVRTDAGHAEIIAAFTGSFGLTDAKHKKGWRDIIVIPLLKDGMYKSTWHLDGTAYKASGKPTKITKNLMGEPHRPEKTNNAPPTLRHRNFQKENDAEKRGGRETDFPEVVFETSPVSPPYRMPKLEARAQCRQTAVSAWCFTDSVAGNQNQTT